MRKKREEGEGGSGLEFLFVHSSVCACVFAYMFCAANILQKQRDERKDTDSTHLLQSWTKHTILEQPAHSSCVPAERSLCE